MDIVVTFVESYMTDMETLHASSSPLFLSSIRHETSSFSTFVKGSISMLMLDANRERLPAIRKNNKENTVTIRFINMDYSAENAV